MVDYFVIRHSHCGSGVGLNEVLIQVMKLRRVKLFQQHCRIFILGESIHGSVLGLYEAFTQVGLLPLHQGKN